MAMTTGLTPQTFENLQLNAGCFVAGVALSAIKSVSDLKAALTSAMNDPEKWLGATRGGGTFQCTPTIRNIEADGKRSEFVGSSVNDGWTVKLSTTLLEATPENFKRVLLSADVETSGSVTTIKPRTAIKPEDYINPVAWVGDTAYGLTAIEMDNVLNLAGATFTFTDKGEGTIPVEFTAHQANLENQEYAPCRVYVLKDA